MERYKTYIHFDTTTGAIGCNLFQSDERLKKINGLSSDSALDLIDQFKFIDFNYLPIDGMDSSVRYPVGFSANQLQEIDDILINEIGGYLSPNPAVLMPYMCKAIQELSAEVNELLGIINQQMIRIESTELGRM